MIDLSGVFIPAVTPFLPGTGEVDLPAMQENLRRWAEFPIRGVVIAGTTGEAVLVDEEERLELVRAAREVLSPEILLTVGTGLESTRATIRLTRKVAEEGADAVLVQPPAYYKGAMTPEALREHYLAVADGSPIPGDRLSGAPEDEHAGLSHRVGGGAVEPREHRGDQGLPREAGFGG